MKCDGTRAETRFHLSPKRTSPIKSAGASVQSTAGSRGVRIGGSNCGYTTFRCSVKSTGYPLHSPVSPSLPLPCVTVCHHISTGLYQCCVAAIIRIFDFFTGRENIKCEKYRLILNYGSWIDITWQSVSGRWQQLETKWFKQDRVTMTASTVESLHVCGDDRPLSNYVESLIRRK